MANSKASGLSIVCAAAVLSYSASLLAAPIEPGSDFYRTKTAQIKLKDIKGMPTIPLVGNPLKSTPSNKLGNTDTIIRRLTSLPAPNGQTGTGTIDIEMVSLSLVSKKPIKVDGTKFDTFVTLNPRKTSTGEIKVKTHKDPRGGAFGIPFLNFFLQVDLIPIAPGTAPIQLFVESTGSASGAGFAHEPPPFYPTIPNIPAGNFYPVTPFGITNGVFSLSLLVPAQVPTPTALTLLGTGLILLGLGRRRAKRPSDGASLPRRLEHC